MTTSQTQQSLLRPNESSGDKQRINKYTIANLVAYITNVAITYGIGVGGWLNLPTNDELSRKYQTLVTPVGWAFAIWGIIFTAQLIWAVYPLFVASQRLNPFVVQAVGFHYVAIVAAQAAWTLSFSFEVIWLSAIVMLLLCAALWSAVLALKRQATGTTTAATVSIPQYLLWFFPFTIHAGWITAASVVNINVVLVAEDMSAEYQFIAALVGLLILFVAACWVVVQKFDSIIALVVAWALIGIYFELRDSTDESIAARFSESQVKIAEMGSIILAAIILTLTAVLGLRTVVKSRG